MNGPKATSVRQRLLNRSRSTGEEYNQLLARYVGLRFLHRLALSPHAHSFVLKGATMFLVWQGAMHRPTRDIDLLGAVAADERQIEEVVRDICSTPCENDGLVFDATRVRAEAIREDNMFGGIRCTVLASLGSARQRLQIDVGFGDVVTPAPEEIELPMLLGHEMPVRLLATTVETVIAEKLETMVTLGMGNSRMKDFLDIATIARVMRVDGASLVSAIGATFQRRETKLPDTLPLALTSAFWTDEAANARWRAFARRTASIDTPTDLPEVCRLVTAFVQLPMDAAARGETFARRWDGAQWLSS